MFLNTDLSEYQQLKDEYAKNIVYYTVDEL